MSSAPTLSSLARIGFANLSDSRESLMREGFDAEMFAVAASPDRALRWLVRLRDSAPEVMARVLADETWRERLVRVVGISDGIGEFFARRPHDVECLRDAILEPPSAAHYIDDLVGIAAASAEPDRDIRAGYRRHLARLIEWDTCTDTPTSRVAPVAAALADLAGAALDAAVVVARSRATYPPNEVAATRLAIIGMGKAGARELNYISDVDVIFVGAGDETILEPHRALEIATHLAQSATRVLSDSSFEPPLWEIDANLRPEGQKGALVRTVESHVAYYERWAQNWEFQALLKARPLAGDRELGEQYHTAVSPFVWSGSSRAGFVESVQQMRERVTAHIPAADVDVQIKLGPGGLRDVEFTVQLLQMVHGKDDDSVRVLDTLSAIDRLAAAGYIGRTEASTFSESYRYLRVLEHRVQLAALRRTHLMPRDPEALRVLARASKRGESGESLMAEWNGVKSTVRSLHERLFYRPLLATVAALGDDTLALTTEQAEARLAASGFRDPAGALRHIAALTAGVARRATIQRNLLPVLLHWMTEGTDPDAGLAAFRSISDSLGDTPWYLRMLRDSAGAAQRLSRVVTMSRFVSLLMERVPESVAWLDDDNLLVPKSPAVVDDEILAIIARHENATDAAKALRGIRRRELLRVALASTLDLISIEELGEALTSITIATLRGALALARRDIAGIEFAIIGMGRFGGSELGFSSDTDVMWVFRDVGLGDDAHRTAERIVRLIGEYTEDLRFPLDIDANLRPEGKNGPIVRSLDAYAAYYERWSDTWETQALVRSRPVAGDESLQHDFEAMATGLRYSQPLSAAGLREIRRIKARVETERLPHGEDANRNLKLGRGSLSDVEWLVQVIQLQHGTDVPELRTTSTLRALRAATEAHLISTPDAQALTDAWILASRVRSAITLWSAKSTDTISANPRELEGIARMLAYPPGQGRRFEDDYLRITRRARQVFERLFYPVD